MSMHLEFEPHSWYFGFAVKKTFEEDEQLAGNWFWEAFTDDGNTYSIVRLHSATLRGLRAEIVRYWVEGKHVPAYYEKKLRRAYERI